MATARRSQATVRQNAETMAAELLAYGWEYVVVDIQWYQPGSQVMNMSLLRSCPWMASVA